MSNYEQIEQVIKGIERLNLNAPEIIIVPDRDYLAMRLMGIIDHALIPASEFFNYKNNENDTNDQ
jgi:hypothetical protein